MYYFNLYGNENKNENDSIMFGFLKKRKKKLISELKSKFIKPFTTQPILCKLITKLGLLCEKLHQPSRGMPKGAHHWSW